MRLLCAFFMLMAHISAAESIQGCPDSPQGLAAAEAAAAGVKNEGTPYLFQARVFVGPAPAVDLKLQQSISIRMAIFLDQRPVHETVQPKAALKRYEA